MGSGLVQDVFRVGIKEGVGLSQGRFCVGVRQKWGWAHFGLGVMGRWQTSPVQASTRFAKSG